MALPKEINGWACMRSPICEGGVIDHEERLDERERGIAYNIPHLFCCLHFCDSVTLSDSSCVIKMAY